MDPGAALGGQIHAKRNVLRKASAVRMAARSSVTYRSPKPGATARAACPTAPLPTVLDCSYRQES